MVVVEAVEELENELVATNCADLKGVIRILLIAASLDMPISLNSVLDSFLAAAN